MLGMKKRIRLYRELRIAFSQKKDSAAYLSDLISEPSAELPGYICKTIQECLTTESLSQATLIEALRKFLPKYETDFMDLATTPTEYAETIQALEEITIHHKTIWRQFFLQLALACFILLMLFDALWGLSFVGRSLGTLYDEMLAGEPLPALTRLPLALSDLFQRHILVILGIKLGLIAVFIISLVSGILGKPITPLPVYSYYCIKDYLSHYYFCRLLTCRPAPWQSTDLLMTRPWICHSTLKRRIELWARNDEVTHSMHADLKCIGPDATLQDIIRHKDPATLSHMAMESSQLFLKQTLAQLKGFQILTVAMILTLMLSTMTVFGLLMPLFRLIDRLS